MAAISTGSASPPNVAQGGGQSKIVPIITNPDQVSNVTVTLDGSQWQGQIGLHETLVWSVNPADRSKKGYVVATVDQGGSLAVGADGASFVFTAA